MLTGALIGLVGGLTGTGGGIYLSPIMVLMGWAEIRQVSGTTAPIALPSLKAFKSPLVSLRPAGDETPPKGVLIHMTPA